MAQITKKQAVDRIKGSIRKLPADDMQEVYGELFPLAPAPSEQGVTSIQKRVDDYIQRGLGVEDILALWRVMFPNDRNVYYDEDTGTIRVNEERPDLLPYLD